MALAGCPDYFLRHSNYQENMDRTSSRRPEDLIVPGFQHPANQNLPHHHDDDVDLEQLVNDMNSSMESVYSTHADTALLLNNGHVHAPHHQHHMHPAYPGHGQAHRRHTPPLPSSSPSRERLRHSQPMHIRAVRCLQEEQQLRPASLPAIPNPFPELCSPAGSPVLSPIQTSENHVSTPTPTHLHSYKLYTKVKNDNCLEEEGAVERFLNDGLPFSACFGGKKRQQLSVVFELLNNYMDIYLIVFYRVVLYLP